MAEDLTALVREAAGEPEGALVLFHGRGADEHDLVIERVNGILAVSDGPRDILGPNPVALLKGAAERREPIDALVARVAEWEARQ